MDDVWGFCSVTYPFHPEATTSVHGLEKVLVLLAAEPAQTGNFKVGPEVAHVVALSLHSLGVNLGQGAIARLALGNLLGEDILDDFWLFATGFQEHFPETL